VPSDRAGCDHLVSQSGALFAPGQYLSLVSRILEKTCLLEKREKEQQIANQWEGTERKGLLPLAPCFGFALGARLG
jgi:hypothetical protein